MISIEQEIAKKYLIAKTNRNSRKTATKPKSTNQNRTRRLHNGTPHVGGCDFVGIWFSLGFTEPLVNVLLASDIDNCSALLRIVKEEKGSFPGGGLNFGILFCWRKRCFCVICRGCIGCPTNRGWNWWCCCCNRCCCCCYHYCYLDEGRV